MPHGDHQHIETYENMENHKKSDVQDEVSIVGANGQPEVTLLGYRMLPGEGHLQTIDEKDQDAVSSVTWRGGLSSPTTNGHVATAKRPKVPPIVPDQGWAWLIMLGSFSCNICVGGVLYSFGVFFLELLDHFGETRAITALVGSIIAGTYATIGPFASMMANKFGCRATTIAGGLITCIGFIISTFSPNIYFMIVTYGFFGGIGFGFTYLTGFIMISNYFVKYRALATGFACSGSGVGTFLFAPLCTVLIETYAWQGGLRIIAGITLNACVMGCLYRPLPQIETKQSDGTKEKKKLIDMGLLKEPACSIVCVATFLAMTGDYIPFVFIPDLTETIGLGKEKGAILLSILGISNTAGRIAAGTITNFRWILPLKLYVGGTFVGGIVAILVPWLRIFPLLCMFAVLFGLSYGGSVSLSTIILQEYLGVERISSSFGFLSLARGLAAFISAPLAGLLYGWTGNHMWMFIIAGSNITLAGMLSMPLGKLQKLYLAKSSKQAKECAIQMTSKVTPDKF